MAEAKSIFNNSFSFYGGPIKQKRKKARVRINTQGIFYLGNKPKPFDCNLVDLGIGGLTIQTGSVLYAGEKVKVEFKLNSEKLTIDGVIARANGKDYVVRYDELPERETSVIQSYIHRVYYKDGKNNDSK